MCSLKFIKIQIKTVLIKTLAVTKIVFLSMAPKEPANIHDNELSSFSSLVFIGTNTSRHTLIKKYSTKRAKSGYSVRNEFGLYTYTAR